MVLIPCFFVFFLIFSFSFFFTFYLFFFFYVFGSCSFFLHFLRFNYGWFYFKVCYSRNCLSLRSLLVIILTEWRNIILYPVNLCNELYKPETFYALISRLVNFNLSHTFLLLLKHKVTQFMYFIQSMFVIKLPETPRIYSLVSVFAHNCHVWTWRLLATSLMFSCFINLS